MYKQPRTAKEKERVKALKARNERRRAEKAAKQRLPEYYQVVKEDSVKDKSSSTSSTTSDDSYNTYDASTDSDYEDSA